MFAIDRGMSPPGSSMNTDRNNKRNTDRNTGTFSVAVSLAVWRALHMSATAAREYGAGIDWKLSIVSN